MEHNKNKTLYICKGRCEGCNQKLCFANNPYYSGIGYKVCYQTERADWAEIDPDTGKPMISLN